MNHRAIRDRDLAPLRRFIHKDEEVSELTQLGECDHCHKVFDMMLEWDGNAFLCSTDCMIESLTSDRSKVRLVELFQDTAKQ